jgi:hypothetical protein
VLVVILLTFYPSGTDRNEGGKKAAIPCAKDGRMLVFLSDFHLTDGTSAATLSPGACEFFARWLQGAAEAASWRTDGSYRPVERIDVVLLGDILDVIRSAHWLGSAGVRPWGDPHRPELVDVVGRITCDILDHNDAFCEMLRSLAGECGIMLAPAMRTGRPATDAVREPVEVRLFYLVGDCDWFFALPGPHYDGIRRKIVDQMGLAQRWDRAFPHDALESEELSVVFRRYKTVARHGDVFDPLSFEGDRCGSSLADALSIELVTRFLGEVEQRLGNSLSVAARAALSEIDHLRPIPAAPVWLEGVLQRTCPSPGARRVVKQTWDRLVDELLAIDYVWQREPSGGVHLVDGMRNLLKFNQRLPGGWMQQVRSWSAKLRGASDESYAMHALAEPDFRNRRARHIVYGHIHGVEQTPLDASYADGFVLNQVYFNAGTWRRSYRWTQASSSQNEFVGCDAMSYLIFYQGDERKGRPYETWSGSLGFHPPEVPTHRMDSGRASHAPAQSVSTPELQAHAPHFAPLPGKGRRIPSRRLS